MRINAINREILGLSLPSIVTNITTPLLGLVDVAIVGHMGAAAYIAAIALGGSMFNMIYWLFAFLRMGTSGMTAQAYGSRNRMLQSSVLEQALLVALVAGIVMILLRHDICHAVLWFMDVDETSRILAERYFLICIWGAPAVLGSYALAGWFLGMQNSKAPMWVAIFINVCNIAASLLLVYWCNFNIEGVALGTLVAQWSGFAMGLSICLLRYDIVLLNLSGIIRWKALKRFFIINSDIFLRTLCLVSVTMWFTRTGSIQGTEILAVNALLMQFFTLFSYFMDGFAFAGEAITGKYIGRSDYAHVRNAIRLLLQWGGGLALLFTILYAVGGDVVLSLLSDDTAVVGHASDYLYWVITIPVVGFVAFTWDGVFIGATNTRSMLMSMFLATGVFFAIYFVAFPQFGNHGLWLAFVCYLLTRGIVLSIIGHKRYMC